MLKIDALLKTLSRCGDVLFAPSCLVCQSSSSQLLCHRCYLPPAIHKNEQSRCTRCHAKIQMADSLCSICSIMPPPFAQARYLWTYNNNARDFCVALKYKPSLRLIDLAARILARELYCLFDETNWDYLIPIPASTAGLKNRGFNHIVVLAQKLKIHSILEAAILSNALMNQGFRKAQVSLSNDARLRGVKKRYKLAPKMSNKLLAKKILLLDDVTTTGATLHAAAETLNNAGVAQIDILTLCRSPSWHDFRSELSAL